MFGLLPLLLFWGVFFAAAVEDYTTRKVRDLLILGLYAGFLLQFPTQLALLAGAWALSGFWFVMLAFPKSEIGWADVMGIMPIVGYAVGSYMPEWVILGFGVACAHEVGLSIRHRERRTPFITMSFVALLIAHFLSV